MNRRRRGPGADPGAVIGVVVMGALFVGCVLVYLALAAGIWSSTGRWPVANPLTAVLGAALGQGSWSWSKTSTLVLLCELLALVPLSLLVAKVLRGRRREGRVRQWREIAQLLDAAQTEGAIERERAQQAARLKIAGDWPGSFVGESLLSRRDVFSPPESLSIDVAGIGRGKTTTRVIPLVLLAPGAVLNTSNKSDVVTATCSRRAALGQTWVFDLQSILGAPAEDPGAIWWNPLRGITTLNQAEELAETLVKAAEDPNQGKSVKSDPFFDNKSQSLLGYALLAAARTGRPITACYEWLTDPGDGTIELELQRHGDRLASLGMRALSQETEKTRSNIYSSTERYISWMTNPDITRWVVPGPGTEFVPETFVTTKDTLYVLSEGGRGSAAPVTTALTMAVCAAAEDYANRCPQQRMNPPLTAVLDELPNVCRWHNLPSMYAHYRSRGVILNAFLQSWAQAIRMWGEEGAKELWDAANCRVYGGGVSDPAFLRILSDMLGNWEMPVETRVPETSGWGTRRSTSTRSEPIASVGQLTALPQGLMVVACSGHEPTIVRAVPHYEGLSEALPEQSTPPNTKEAAA